MRSKRGWHGRPQMAMALGIAAMSAACDKPQPTEVASGAVATLAKAANNGGGSTDQSYDVVVESARDGARTATHQYHVDRHRTAKGWRTRVVMAPDERLAGTGDYDRQIGAMEIDEDGNQTAVDRTGRPVGQAPSGMFEEARAKAPGKYSAGIASQKDKRPGKRSDRQGKAGKRAFDVVDVSVKSKAENDAGLRELRGRLGAPRRDPLGREHYSHTQQDASVDIVADPTRGVVTEVTRSAAGSAPEKVQYEYADDGDRTVRRKIRYAREKTAKSPGSSLTITLSRITIDGKEIRP